MSISRFREGSPSGRSRARLPWALLCVALAFAGIGAPGASAGKYRAAQCHPLFGAGHGDAAFTRTSDQFVAGASCAGGDGLGVSHDGSGTRAGRWGAWTLTAPAGIELLAVRGQVSGAAAGGYDPELALSGPAGAESPIGSAAGDFHAFSWSGTGATALTARLRCARQGDCGPGRDARIGVRRLVLRLRDGVAPTVGASGSVLAAGSRRGPESLAATASDVGAGVRRFVLEVNGHPVDARGVPCELSGRMALRLRPCPPGAGTDFAVATAADPFIQGPNELRLCTLDYAANTGANRACVSHEVRVDNACPLSPVPGGATLQARFRDGTSKLRLRRGERAHVDGRLLDASGNAVAGARVCLAQRLPLDGRAETVLATPLTDAEGRFSAAVPPGASREVRVAYWPSAEGAVERMLDLRVAADPRLRLRPAGTLRNGERMRFSVRLPGPAAAGRSVSLEVRSGGRWLRLRHGKTGGRGVWRSSYRFHATTGRRTYRFRASVPEQAGYPYAAGVSRVRRKTVTG
jgi:hypothetical protein